MEEPENTSESSYSEGDYYENAHNALRTNIRGTVLPTTPRSTESHTTPNRKHGRAPQTPHAKHATNYAESSRTQIPKIYNINAFESLKALSRVLAVQKMIATGTSENRSRVSSDLKENDESAVDQITKENNDPILSDMLSVDPEGAIAPAMAEVEPLVETESMKQQAEESQQVGEPQLQVEAQKVMHPDQKHVASSPQKLEEDETNDEDPTMENPQQLGESWDGGRDGNHDFPSASDVSIALGTKSDFADTSLATDLISLSSENSHQPDSAGRTSSHSIPHEEDENEEMKEWHSESGYSMPQDQDDYNGHEGQYDDLSDNDPSYKQENKRLATSDSDYTEEEVAIPSDFSVIRPIMMDDISFIQPPRSPAVKKPKRRNRMAKPINPGSTGPARKIAKSLKLETAIPRAIVRDLVHTVSGAKLAPDAFEEIINVSNMFFEQAMKDLTDIAEESDRSLIKPADVVRLLEAQKLTDSKATPFSIAHRYLPAELLNSIISDVN